MGFLDDLRPRIEALREAIIAGEIVVPCVPEDRADVEPAPPSTCTP